MTRRTFDKIFTWVGVALTALLVVGGVFALNQHNVGAADIHQRLVHEKVSFPKQGSAGFEPAKFPDLQKYAGQQVDNGAKARDFADGYIGRHLDAAGQGQTYAEVSALSKASPNDAKLTALKATLFDGSVLRSELLTIYGFSLLSDLALKAAWLLFIGAGLMFLLVAGGVRQVWFKKVEPVSVQ